MKYYNRRIGAHNFATFEVGQQMKDYMASVAELNKQEQAHEKSCLKDAKHARAIAGKLRATVKAVRDAKTMQAVMVAVRDMVNELCPHLQGSNELRRHKAVLDKLHKDPHNPEHMRAHAASSGELARIAEGIAQALEAGADSIE